MARRKAEYIFVSDKPKRNGFGCLFTVLAMVLAIGLAGFFYNMATNNRIQLMEEKVSVMGLNRAYEGFTILHISDLHASAMGGNADMWTSVLFGKKWDAVVMSGDMVGSGGDFEPLLSVVIPAYKTPERYLREMLDSIVDQTYTNWEICIADGSPRGQGLERVLKKYADRDKRIRYEILGSNRGIAGNTNAALDMARGDFVILADHDDTLPPHAFYEVVKAIHEHPGCQVIYSDEDKLDMDGKALFDPHFKPDFNPDLLTSVNYICHLFVVRKDLLERVGGFRQEFDGAQDYDFIFRCTEAAREVYHIPKVLYHWRCHQDSTASNPES